MVFTQKTNDNQEEEEEVMKILIVDDEEDILELLEYNLQKEGYEVSKAGDGEEAIKIALHFQPEVILLDIMMPKMDGVETCRKLRAMPLFKNTYILFLTARTEEYSELAGFEAGADDYIIKPIKPRVLISRIKAVMRRNNEVEEGKEHEVLKIQDLEIVKEEYIVRKGEETISLPRKEFELLYLLASKPGRIFRREEVLEKVWGDVYVVDRTVDVHIRKLREKLGDECIQTIKGVGYKMNKE
ncbi:MAG: response regulator transcription factor [Bacteroidia bacterium]